MMTREVRGLQSGTFRSAIRAFNFRPAAFRVPTSYEVVRRRAATLFRPRNLWPIAFPGARWLNEQRRKERAARFDDRAAQKLDSPLVEASRSSNHLEAKGGRPCDSTP
jgi:hypothetical protein